MATLFERRMVCWELKESVLKHIEPELEPGEKQVIVIFQDESSFHMNKYKQNIWYAPKWIHCNAAHMYRKVLTRWTDPLEKNAWLHHSCLQFCREREWTAYHPQQGRGDCQGCTNHYLSGNRRGSLVGSCPIAGSSQQGNFYFQGGASGVCWAFHFQPVLCVCLTRARCSSHLWYK